MPSPVLFRFGRDLRVDDHAGLAAAAQLGDVLGVVVIDRALEAALARSPRRAAFYCAVLRALEGELRSRGARLIVRRGAAGAALKRIARATGASGVVWSASYDGAGVRDDARLQSELEEAGLRASIVHDLPAIPPEETAAARSVEGAGYRAFVPYYEVWRTLRVGSYEAPLLLRFAHSDLQSEPLPQPAEFGSQIAEPDASPARAREKLTGFLSESAVQYALAMNVPSDGRTSHLSADLSFGTIAARTVVRATLERMDDPFLLTEERASLRTFLRSIAMRDFFLQLSWFHPEIDSVPLQEKMRDFRSTRSHAALGAWRSGKTGYPLVDAGIRQLHATGWMHPHVRSVAAAFLCFDLGVDWRVGRDEWDAWLIEDDRALANGNWQWIAGVGADMAQYPRIYNPDKQRRRFDPLGTYVRQWVEELAHAPVTSWDSSHRDDAQIALPLFAQDGYPQPVVDHESAARAFLARYREHLAPTS